MNLQGLMLSALIGAGVIAGGWLWYRHEVSAAHDAGYAAAAAAGEKQRSADADAALARERTLRTKLAAADAAAQTKETEYAETLSAAQRRLRAGDDSLRIAVRTIRATATIPTGSVAGGSAPDESRAELVPEVAADAVGFAATAAGIVRKYERLVDRYEECRTLNNGPSRATGK